MTERIAAPHVGAPDPERRTSPILEETAEGYAEQAQLLGGMATCYFNDIAYTRGDYICSGDELLRCQDGIWLRQGSCDPVNP